MKKLKKILAAILASAMIGTMMVSAFSASALNFNGYFLSQGIYYTEEELEEVIQRDYTKRTIWANFDESVSEITTDENGNVQFVLDVNSEVYKYMVDSFKLTSNVLAKTKSMTNSDNETEEKIYAEISFNGVTDSEYTEILNNLKNMQGVTLNIATSEQLLSSLGEPVDVEPLTGDLSMDGKVNIVDAVKLAKYNADPTAYPLLTYSQLAADVNGDGELTNADLIALVKMI